MSNYSMNSPTHTSSSSYDSEKHLVRFLHTIPQPGRVLPSSSKWNSIELDFNLAPKSSINYDSISSPYSKSYDYELVITDRKYLNRFLTICATIAIAIAGILLLVHFLPHKHHHHRAPSKNLALALNQALTFFDAQKSGNYPRNSRVIFRGDSGLQDGNSSGIHADLVGGFYDSGRNIKFTFPTAYTITLLSWSVIEYHKKYFDINELDHVKDIIKWGSDYLLKVFVPPNSKSRAILYSQVGSTDTDVDSDVKCWQRPEDMTYERPVSVCDGKASDLAGEIIAALSAASIVFKEDDVYSVKLVKTAEKLYNTAHSEDQGRKESTYTSLASCGGKARNYYNSSGYKDELVWGSTWLFFATGNASYLRYATENFAEAVNEETKSDKSVFYWNNKLNAIAVLLTRLRFFHDLGYPYEDALRLSTDITDNLMCTYKNINKTPGGLIFLNPGHGGPLQFAATASFLTKLYADYLLLLSKSGGKCKNDDFSVEMLEKFSAEQINYILGDNPMKISYMVGYGDNFPNQVHHRGASIPWDSQHHPCSGEEWLYSKNPNPNILVGAMVPGPDQFDKFFDQRDKPRFTEPSIASNAGLVAALIAIHDDSPLPGLGIDKNGMFQSIH